MWCVWGLCMCVVWGCVCGVCGVCVEYVWCVCGVCVVYVWCVCGVCVCGVRVCVCVYALMFVMVLSYQMTPDTTPARTYAQQDI